MVAVTATPDPTTGTTLVQVEQTLMRDLFTRVVAGGWGSPTVGNPWVNSGGVAGDYSVNGTQGLASVNAVSSTRRTTVDVGLPDHDLTMQVTIAVVASGNNIEPGLMLRYTDANNYYYAALMIAPSGTVTLQIKKRSLGVTANVSTTVILTGAHTAGASYFIRAAVCGSTLKAKAWFATTTEPSWMLTASDFDLTTGNLLGQRSNLEIGNTNVLPVVFAWDNAVAIVGQPIRVFRTVDGVSTEMRGSPLNTNAQTAAASSATATLWDNEGPFNVSTTYSLRGSCADTNVVTSTPITLTSDFGWLRDPTDPTRNIPLSEYAVYDPCEVTDTVVFSGLGDPNYESASGIYDLIDAARPTTISQTRKNYASSLALTSFSTDDLIRLEDLYSPGTILVLSLPVEYGWAMRTSGTDYITIGDIEQAHIGRDQRVTARQWSMPFRLSLAPPDPSEPGTGGNGIGGGGATYDDLAASALGLTYNSLTASALTYDQVAAGTGY